jgi:hypothetical protein
MHKSVRKGPKRQGKEALDIKTAEKEAIRKEYA